MKAFTKILLVSAVLSGAVSVRVHRSGERLVIETETENPAEIFRTAGKLLSAAGKAMNQAAGTAAPAFDAQASCEQSDGQTFYRVRLASGDPASQIGAYLNPETAVQMCPEGYCVFDTDGRMLWQHESSEVLPAE